MSVTIFAENLIEGATISATPDDTAERLARLFDRCQSMPWVGASGWGMAGMFSLAMGMSTPAEWILDIDLGSAQPVTGWALVNQNITGVTVSLYGSAASPASDLRDSFDPAGAVHTLRTFASLTFRYWRVVIPAPASAPSIGELLLGVPRVIDDNPGLESAGRFVLGNVASHASPAGYVRSVKRGAARVRLPWAWAALDATDETARAAAYADSDEGAKAVLVRDEDGTLRWMKITDAASEPRPVKGAPAAADRLYAAALTLEESLL